MAIDHHRQFWQQHITAWQSSGMTQRAYALVHSMTVVTRNVDNFKYTGVNLINPWEVTHSTSP